MKSSKAIVEAYLKQSDWRTKENSNSPFSFGAMNKYITAEVSKDYWLREVYPEHVAQAYVDGHMHIHDLGGLTLYCSGYSLREILMKGVRGISNIPVSAPAKHFDSVLNQCANLVTVFQNEIMGAVAFNSFDTLLAPFIKVDKLGYNEVRQAMQNFIFSVNSNSRGGAEPAFFNLTFDLTPPADMIEDYAIVGGELVSFTYGSCQQEMDLLNRVFFEIMLEGDASGKLFSYPIPTYMIHRRFDWDNPNNKLLWEMAGKYGVPYFANYINSDMDIGDVRSMCCRLSLDLRELRRRNGGLFGSGDSTGSIGVVTLNLPRLAYEAHGDRQKFWDSLDRYMDIAKESLEIKRKWLNENVIDTHLLPAFMEYVGSLRNYFSTIGMIGGNEMCLNLIGKDIRSDEGHALMRDVLNHMRERLVMYQEETGNLYNLEGTPAEGCSYSLALKDKKEYPDIITQGSGGKDVYYTNSCHIWVGDIQDINSTFAHQNDLQPLFTGGTVIHCYMDGAIPGEHAKQIVRTMLSQYNVPYMSISPISRYCPEHGYVMERVDKCPICKQRLHKFQRITGYLRDIDNFNRGKANEFKDRVQLTE